MPRCVFLHLRLAAALQAWSQQKDTDLSPDLKSDGSKHTASPQSVRCKPDAASTSLALTMFSAVGRVCDMHRNGKLIPGHHAKHML